MDLGFGFVSGVEPTVVAGALERFKPDVTEPTSVGCGLQTARGTLQFELGQVLVPDISGQVPESLAAGGGRQYVVKVLMACSMTFC